MFNNILTINKKYITFIFLLILFWLSINTGSKYLYINQFENLNFSYYQNFIRSILPYLILFFFLIKYNDYLSGLKINNDLFFLSLFLYGIFQIIGLFSSDISNNEHYWAVCLFSLIIYFKTILDNKNPNLVNVILVTNILFVFAIFLIFISIALKENIVSYNLLYHSKIFFYKLGGEYLPRSTGLSRMALIVFYFFTFVYLSKMYAKRINFILLFIISFLIFVILILQSRTVILFFVISYLAINLIFKFNNFKERLIFYLFTFILPLFLFFSYPISKNFLIEKFNVNTEAFKEDKDKVNFMRNDFVLDKENMKNLKSFDVVSFSNNRIEAWNYLLQIFLNGELNYEMKKKVIMKKFKPKEFNLNKKLRYFFGLGPQADRHLMQLEKMENMSATTLGPFGAHASNLFVYSLICGGFLSFFIFVLINLLIVFKIFKVIKNHKKLRLTENYILISSIFIILFLMFRSLIENSYGVFGVDLIIFLSTYTVIEKNLKIIND